MIYCPLPETWQQLQEWVCTILQQCGITAEIEKTLTTPRGSTTVDVFGTDEHSVDQITYIVECKNWNQAIPQTVIHSFTTVMQETGANIGYIISKTGFQKGALQYISNTNIRALTFDQFQQHYLHVWLQHYFIPAIGEISRDMLDYTEPINSYRERRKRELPMGQQEEFLQLYEQYHLYGNAVLACHVSNRSDFSILASAYGQFGQFKKALSLAGPAFQFHAQCFTELLAEMTIVIQQITGEFNRVFGENIFQQHR